MLFSDWLRALPLMTPLHFHNKADIWYARIFPRSVLFDLKNWGNLAHHQTPHSPSESIKDRQFSCFPLCYIVPPNQSLIIGHCHTVGRQSVAIPLFISLLLYPFCSPMCVWLPVMLHRGGEQWGADGLGVITTQDKKESKGDNERWKEGGVKGRYGSQKGDTISVSLKNKRY